jgi:hypothetical protein
LIAYGSRAAWHPNSRPLGAFNEHGADSVRVVGSAARGEDTDSRDIDLDLSMLIPGVTVGAYAASAQKGARCPLLDEQRRQIGFLIRPQAARLPLANAPVAQPAEAGPLKGPQCGFESHRGHPYLPLRMPCGLVE